MELRAALRRAVAAHQVAVAALGESADGYCKQGTYRVRKVEHREGRSLDYEYGDFGTVPVSLFQLYFVRAIVSIEG